MPTTYAIPNGATQFAASLYTGTGNTTQVITNGNNNPTGVTFAPDLVWLKDRTSAGQFNLVQDIVRGAGKSIFTNSTNAEAGNANDLIGAFNSNGFSVNENYVGGTNTTSNAIGDSYVAWQWKGTGSTASNTNGSITSTVDANTTAGFSIVTYTGTGANATVGHGLGVAPSMVIVKKRGAVGDWPVYHIGLTSAAYNLYLDATNAQAIDSPPTFNSTAPTSSVFSLSSNTQVNASGVTAVAYCFAQIPGYSAFGSYTGNGSTDGTFVYLGFRPRWILLKNTGGTASWYCLDSSRDTYNVMADVLVPNTSAAEVSITSVDFLSNGFKLRTTTTDINGSGTTYIYAAFAENPFKYANAR